MKTHIGIDVSKKTLQIDQPGQPSKKIENTPKAIAAWLKDQPRETHLILEATGGYERPLLEAARQREQPHTLVNPRAARDFARSLGLLAKTDKIDARALRLYGEKLEPTATPPPDAGQETLREWTGLREDLAEQLQALKNREEHHRNPAAKKHLRAAMHALEKRLAKIDAEIETYLQEQAPELNNRIQTLCLVPGVSNRTAITLVAHLKGLGRYNDRAIAKEAGLAPLNHDSGQMRGQRHIYGGNPVVRKVLYMAALVASQHNDWLKAKYEKLIKTKAPKVALIAIARKLLVWLNQLLKPALQSPT